MNTAIATLKYLPIPEDMANEARATMRDGFGHELTTVQDKAPCRVCLRISKEPEDLIVLSYRPLADRGPYAEIGPVFIHAKRCEPYGEATIFPNDFANRRLVLRAYGYDGRIVDAEVAEPGTAPARAAAFLSDDEIEEVHVRHESYTCFHFKIVRA